MNEERDTRGADESKSLPLWDVCENKHGGADTSVEAFASLSPGKRRTICLMIFEYIRKQGGATCDECAYGLDLLHQTASARITELQVMGAIVDSKRRRKTKSGRSARVYVEATHEQLERLKRLNNAGGQEDAGG